DNLKTLLQQKPEPCTRVEIKGGAFELTDAGLVYVADSLYGALVLKLFSLSEGKKLRRCLKPDCDCRPYFIADHGRQQYCSENCAAWAQTQFKKKWWAKEGPHWREQQAKQKKQLSRNRKRPSGKVENRG